MTSKLSRDGRKEGSEEGRKENGDYVAESPAVGSFVLESCTAVKREEKNKKTPDGNKLAGGVCAEPESLKADLPSKWLNLAFVEARKRSRSLAHNLPQ